MMCSRGPHPALPVPPVSFYFLLFWTWDKVNGSSLLLALLQWICAILSDSKQDLTGICSRFCLEFSGMLVVGTCFFFFFFFTTVCLSKKSVVGKKISKDLRPCSPFLVMFTRKSNLSLLHKYLSSVTCLSCAAGS